MKNNETHRAEFWTSNAGDRIMNLFTFLLSPSVRERTAELEAKNTELERMNRLFVGRELRMIELKNHIRELELRCCQKFYEKTKDILPQRAQRNAALEIKAE